MEVPEFHDSVRLEVLEQLLEEVTLKDRYESTLICSSLGKRHPVAGPDGLEEGRQLWKPVKSLQQHKGLPVLSISFPTTEC